MKQKLILIVIAFLISACTSQPANWGDMKESDIASWRNAGVVVGDVEKFVKENLSARDILEWGNADFKIADEIISWHKGGFTSTEAKEWKDKGFDVAEAKAWNKSKFTLNEAVSWKSADFSLKQAIKDRAQGLIPNP